MKRLIITINIDNRNLRSLADASLVISAALISYQQMYGFMPDEGDGGNLITFNHVDVGNWICMEQ